MAVKSVKANGNGKSTVSANVYHDTAGNILPANDKTAVAAAYRAVAATLCDEGESLADMTVDQIYSIVSAIPGNGPEVDQARALAVYEYSPVEAEATDTGSDTPEQLAIRVSAYRGSAEAFRIGQAFDATTNAHFKALADAKEDFDGAPLPIGEDMKRLRVPYLQLPKPGSRFDKPPYSTGMSNEPTDYYKVTDASGQEIKGSVYADMIAASDFGKSCDRLRVLVKEVESNFVNMKDSDKAELTGLLKPIQMSAADLANDANKLVSAKRYVDNRRNAVVQKLRKAVAYLQQEDVVNALPGFRVQRIAESIEASAKQRDPIELVYVDAAGKIHKSKGLSLGTFIRFDIPKARAMAEAEKVPVTIGTLLATTKRKPKSKTDKAKDGTAKANARPLATNIHDWTNDVYSVSGYLTTKDRFAIVQTAVQQENAEAHALIEAIGDLYSELDGLMPTIEVRYRRIKANKARLIEGVAATAGGKAGDQAAA